MQHLRLVKVVVKLVCVIAGEAASRLQVQQCSGSMAGELTIIYGGSCLQPRHPRCLPACHSTAYRREPNCVLLALAVRRYTPSLQIQQLMNAAGGMSVIVTLHNGSPTLSTVAKRKLGLPSPDLQQALMQA